MSETRRTTETQTEFTLRLIRADAWDEGALWAAVECGAIGDGSVPWLTPDDNPYRDTTPHREAHTMTEADGGDADE